MEFKKGWHQALLKMGVKQLVSGNKANFFRLVAILVAVFFSSILLGLIFSSLTYLSLTQANFNQATTKANLARAALAPANILTLDRCKTILAWRQALVLSRYSEPLTNSFQQGLAWSDAEAAVFTPELSVLLEGFQQDYQSFYHSYSDSLLSKITPKSHQSTFSKINQVLPDLVWLVNHLHNQELKIVFLLQNSDELRATGGFIGSLAALKLQGGQLDDPTFYDVYDLSNRAGRLPNPPEPIKKYLSAGQGMALTDANWYPEFPQSAQKINQLLANTELGEPDVLVAVNLKLIEQLLLITGPVTLPDSAQEVTAANLSTLARQDRLEFFAGDKQKKQFLQQLYLALKHTLPQLDWLQQLKLLQLLSSAAKQKNLVLYSQDSALQQLLEDWHLDGTLPVNTDYYLYLLESNVGINKANQAVERSVKLDFQSDSIAITIEFDNQNAPLSPDEKIAIRQNPDLLQADHLGYVNYQRVLTNLPIKQAQVICGGGHVELEEEGQIVTNQGEASLIAFLVTVPEQTRLTCRVLLQPDRELRGDQTWSLVKQPGLPLLLYTINYFGATNSTYLSDVVYQE